MTPTQLTSKWPVALDLAGSNKPCRLEGEVADLVVLGKIPLQLDGTFYRVMTDPFVPPHPQVGPFAHFRTPFPTPSCPTRGPTRILRKLTPTFFPSLSFILTQNPLCASTPRTLPPLSIFLPQNAPIDGDGNVSAFRIQNGRADFKMKYIRTDRFKLEKAAGKALFGLYRNPYSHHPCVQAAVDTTANTNIVFWAGRLLALKEVSFSFPLRFLSNNTNCASTGTDIQSSLP